MNTDPHGQPFKIRFNRARRAERDLCEMLGLVKGMLADGVVNDQEVHYLINWAAEHPDATEQWPVNIRWRCAVRYGATREQIGLLLTNQSAPSASRMRPDGPNQP